MAELWPRAAFGPSSTYMFGKPCTVVEACAAMPLLHSSPSSRERGPRMWAGEGRRGGGDAGHGAGGGRAGGVDPGREHEHVQLVAAAACGDRRAAAAAADRPASVRDPGQRGRLEPDVIELQGGVVVIGEQDPLAADLVIGG